MNTIVVINQQGMGHDNHEVGIKILCSFLNKANRLEGLRAILFYNSGVKLLTANSPALQPLSVLYDQGVDLVACGTCVDHFNIKDEIAVGSVGTMDDLLTHLNQATKVVTL